MSCHEFWKDPTAANGHLDACRDCAAAWAGQRRLAADLRSLAAVERETEAPAHLESRLVAAFRGHTGFRSRRQRPRWIPMLAWGSAVAALATALLFPAPYRGVSPVQLADAGISRESAELRGAAAGEFIPLPHAAQLDPNEEVNLVRVEIPRSAILALGLEAGDGEESDSVAADVVLGYDGLARAVRFLDE